MSSIPRNLTPTFRLTSIEKPDMSPYLFHMTNKESLESILSQKELKAQIPRGSKKYTYDIPMVCFTDSPPFALDFFRYRWSDPRDRQNLKYGIGFDKEAMVKKGVFPTFYVDYKLQAKIMALLSSTKIFKDNNISNKLECLKCDDEKTIENLQRFNTELNELLEETSNTLLSVKRLMFPLLENNPKQGFIWEREWRYATADHSNFGFSYDDIKIICCADENDENTFKKIIGEDSIEKNKIQFIRTWKEYDGITDFLNRRTQDIDTTNGKIQKFLKKIDEKEGIERYLDYLQNQAKTISEIEKLKEDLDKEIRELPDEIKKKISLVKICENIIELARISDESDESDESDKLVEIKFNIMETDCEIVIKSIAAYQEYKKRQEDKNLLITKPASCLLKAITKPWKPNSINSEQTDEIRKQMKEIIEKL